MPPKSQEHREFLDLMEEVGWSQAETARKLGMTTASISRFVNGKVNPARVLMHFRRAVSEELLKRKPFDTSERNQKTEVQEQDPSDSIAGVVLSGRGSSNAPDQRSRMYQPAEQIGGVELREEKEVQLQLAELKKHSPQSYETVRAIIDTTYRLAVGKKNKGK